MTRMIQQVKTYDLYQLMQYTAYKRKNALLARKVGINALSRLHRHSLRVNEGIQFHDSFG